MYATQVTCMVLFFALIGCVITGAYYIAGHLLMWAGYTHPAVVSAMVGFFSFGFMCMAFYVMCLCGQKKCIRIGGIRNS